MCVLTNQSAQINSSTNESVGDEFRGYKDLVNLMTKDFAIAYDRMICLVDGEYEIQCGTHMNADADGAHYIKVRHNGGTVRQAYHPDTGNGFVVSIISIHMKRGDTCGFRGVKFEDENSIFQIKRV